MERNVDRLANEEDREWSADPLRLRILKQFIKYGNYLYDAGFGGRGAIRKYAKEKAGGKSVKEEEVIKNLDDGIFSLLQNAKPDQKKPKGTYGLLKLADDLAYGKFRTEGATKRGLYLFAIVFNMTYFSGTHGQIRDEERDITKNLFIDYYCCNLMRFLTDSYRNHLQEFELDPSGQGINYKNFEEMVYLYYISTTLTPVEKIKRSREMIDEIKKAAELRKASGGADFVPPRRDTVYLRGNVFAGQDAGAEDFKDVLRFDREDFIKYILDNYDCTDGENHGSMQLGTDQVTAFSYYNKLIQDLEDINGSIENDCEFGIWFVDTGMFLKDEQDPKTVLGIAEDGKVDPVKFRDFKELLVSIDRFLKRNESGKVKALYIDKASDVTRTSMMVAYYYYYNSYYDGDEDTLANKKSFREMYDDFSSGINDILIESGYQPVSGKNIFDIILVFSSYAYLTGCL